MKNHKFTLMFALTWTLLSSACAAPATVPPNAVPTLAAVAQPTAVAAPATTTVTAVIQATVVPATSTANATAVPPTKTSTPMPEIPPTNAPTMTPSPTAAASPTATLASRLPSIAEIMRAAQKMNESIKSYRGELVQQSGDGAPETWKGEVRVPDVHYTYSTGTEQRELITVGNDFYLRNNKSQGVEWFLLPETEHHTYNIQAPRPTITELAGFYGTPGEAQTAILNSYRKTATVALDGQSCEVYAMDKRAAASNFLNLWTQKEHLFPPADESAAIFEQAEIKVWLCRDGYLHQLQMTLNPAAEYSGLFKPLKISAHIYDLNVDIQIVAPTNVQPFPSPTP